MPNGKKLICADPVVDMNVEKIIVHKNYSDLARNKQHDIALIRLAANVKESNYIKPICLPHKGFKSGLRAGNKLTVAGWGRTDLCK